jgi:hypothetical protein
MSARLFRVDRAENAGRNITHFRGSLAAVEESSAFDVGGKPSRASGTPWAGFLAILGGLWTFGVGSGPALGRRHQLC